MNLTFSGARVDGTLTTHWDALVRVVGFFAVVIDDRRWYEEEDFCLVEFAAALVAWLDELRRRPVDFVYASVESDEPELLRFACIGDGRWQVQSPHEAYSEERTFSTEEVKLAGERFLGVLSHSLPERQRVLTLLASREEHRRLAATLHGAAS